VPLTMEDLYLTSDIPRTRELEMCVMLQRPFLRFSQADRTTSNALEGR
jgi:hypothetical protein